MATLPTATALAARCVHIKVYPTPRSLPERRQVLRVLERFGDVDMFRSLRYDASQPVPNAFHSIFRASSSATAAIAASPLRYTLIADGEPSVATSNSQLQASTPTAQPSAETETWSRRDAETQLQAQTETRQENMYEVRISPSNYPHLSAVASNPLHGPYMPISASRSAIAADLLTRLPPTAARPGMADWVTDAAVSGAGMSLRSVAGRDVEVGKGREVRSIGKKGKHYGSQGVPWRIRDRLRSGVNAVDLTGNFGNGKGAAG